MTNCQALLEEDDAQTQQQLADQLNDTKNHLHTSERNGKDSKDGKMEFHMKRKKDNRKSEFTNSFALNRYQNVQLLVFHHLVLCNDLHRLPHRVFLRRMVCPSVPTGSHLSGLLRVDGISAEGDAVSSTLRQEHGRRTRTLWINFLKNST
ncbi:hypothetical protein CDAR_164651 [Caerostris darwini]|uniref:Uncharacterized protein n=1 Tax=Caerostris darwini TaxID=1538125 RepID=A0AAV4QQ94_9ARAC|nr:hypothetical protein CDAR_164651 [Caerostris darwini]